LGGFLLNQFRFARSSIAEEAAAEKGKKTLTHHHRHQPLPLPFG
jgi:hypothetical protein